jgi:hypothetical protein
MLGYACILIKECDRQRSEHAIMNDREDLSVRASPRKRVLESSRLITVMFLERSEKSEKLSCLNTIILLPKRRDRCLLHREFVASVEQRVRVLRSILDSHFHCDGHGEEDMETRH